MQPLPGSLHFELASQHSNSSGHKNPTVAPLAAPGLVHAHALALPLVLLGPLGVPLGKKPDWQVMDDRGAHAVQS